jgi:biotin carboxylase
VRIAIVDGYSGGRYLAERLTARGVRCFHVHSSPDVIPALTRSFRSDGIERDLGYAHDIDAIAQELAALGVDKVMPGTESGVEVAEALAHALGLPTNGDRPSQLRRDKSLMAEALRRAGLAAPVGSVARKPAEAAAWAAAHPGDTVVVKPLDSGGSDHVFFCASPNDAAAAVESVLGARNIYGEPNGAALVQERLLGPEYYLNTVSAGGTHRVVETWRYAKLRGPGESLLYDYEEPVDHSAPEIPHVHGYVRAVLDALEVRDGAAHTEVILTEQGPVLLDCGARLCGGFIPHVIEDAIGFSQLSVLVETIVDADAIEAFDESSWEWTRAFRNVFLINDRAGVAGDLAVADELRALPSFVELALAVTPGERVPATTDLVTSPGYVYLSAPTRAELERDYRRIRELERRSPFVAAEPAPWVTASG